jgi:hypothetical protein
LAVVLIEALTSSMSGTPKLIEASVVSLTEVL